MHGAMDADPGAHPLTRLFAPRRVAVVGASADARKVAGRPVRYLAARGYAGEVWGVNPVTASTGTTLAAASVDALPDGIDVAILCIPVDGIVDAVAACGRRKIPFAIVFANGFADTGNHALQDELGRVARAGGVRLVGPNCLGVMDFATGFAGTFASRMDTRNIVHGPVGLVSQSGAVGNTLMLSFEALGLGVSAWMASGNEVDIDALEGIEYMLGRDDTTVVGAMLEAVRAAGPRVQALGRISRACGKPILALKSGKSEASKAAAQSHAGKIVGSSSAWRQVSSAAGWLEMASLEHLTDVALAMGPGGWRSVGEVAILCGSGGMGGLFCDDLTAAGVPLAQLVPATLEALADVLPAAAGIGNPVDPTTVSEDVYYRAAELLARDPAVGTVILLVNSLARNYTELPARVTALQAIARTCGTRVAISYFSPYDVLSLTVEQQLLAAGVLVLPTGARLARALGSVRCWQMQEGDATGGGAEAAPEPVLQDARDERDAGPALSLPALRDLLQHYDIASVATATVTDVDAALAMASPASGRVVLKLEGTAIAHKTEHGLVRAGLAGRAAVEAAFTDLERLRQHHGGAIVAQAHLADTLEVLVAGIEDTELGRLIMVGLGGVFVELFEESSVAPCPIDVAAARRLLDRGRLGRMLRGYRGAAPRDIDALAQLVAACSRLWSEHPEYTEFELNPVMVGAEGAGAWAVDALAIARPATS